MRFLILTIAILVISMPAMAQSKGKVMQCGVPETPTLETDPAMDFCDIYSRQLAYHQEQQNFRKLLEERRKNYVQPRNEAYNAYRQKIRNSRYQ